jgi:xylan 1,4-beta-xylosidase
MGSPQNPTADQIEKLEKAGGLETHSEPVEIKITNTIATIKMQLPRQAVYLVKISY